MCFQSLEFVRQQEPLFLKRFFLTKEVVFFKIGVDDDE